MCSALKSRVTGGRTVLLVPGVIWGSLVSEARGQGGRRWGWAWGGAVRGELPGLQEAFRPCRFILGAAQPLLLHLMAGVRPPSILTTHCCFHLQF